MSVNIWKPVGVWGDPNVLTLDSTPTAIYNQVQASVQISTPAVVPTTGNTSIRFDNAGGVQATVDSVTGSDPYTVNFTFARTAAKKFDSTTGYALHISVGVEELTSSAIPYHPTTGQAYIDLVNPVNTAGTMGETYTGSPSVNGDQWVYDTTLTNDDTVDLEVDDKGYWILSTGPYVSATADYYRIAADGTVDVVDTITFAPIANTTITGLSAGPYYVGDTVTVNLVNANATGKTLSIPAGALTVDTQDATTMTFTVPDPKTFGDQTTGYVSNIVLTVTDGLDTDTVGFQIAPTVGHYHATLTATTGIYSNDVGIAIGDKAYGYWVSGTGDAQLTVGAISSPLGGTFRYWVQDDTDNTWGSSADEIIPASNNPATGNVTITGNTVVGNVLTADTSGISDPDGIASFTYQWKRGGTNISGQTNSTYTSVNGDIGNLITVEVNMTDNLSNVEGPFTSSGVTITSTPDITAPVISAPTGTSTGTTTADGTVITDEGNGTLYYYASTNVSETANTIRTSGDPRAVSGPGVQNVSVIGLTHSTNYYLHYVHVDGAGNESNVESSVAFTTDTPADTTAPVLSNGLSSAIAATTAVGSVVTDEANGTLYYLINTSPTTNLATVKAGSSQTVTLAGTQNVNFTNLTQDTTYYVHFVHTDAAGNDSNIITTASFTTPGVVSDLVITAISTVRLGRQFTITTDGAYDLTTATLISATIEGIQLTGLANVTATTCDFTCPASGLSLVDTSDVILTINV